MAAGLERWRYMGVLALLTSVALLLCFRLGYLYVANANRFPINTVKVEANYQHISRQQIESLLSTYLTYSFFSLPVHHLEQALLGLDWTEDAIVRRVWPDVLRIKIVEKKPVARWNNALITADGHVFYGKGLLQEQSELTELRGPASQQNDILQIFQKLSKLLETCDLRMTSMQLYENQSCDVIIMNHVYLRLGKHDLEKRLERFCKAYHAHLAEKVDQLVSVDLRYERGMAVRWRQQVGR